jgi:opacity protein-like surface antigen
MKRFFGLVVLVALLVSVGSAQQIGLKAIGGGVGYTSFSLSSGGSSESLGGFAIGAVANLGEVTQGLSLYPSVIYSSASKDVNSAKWKLSDFAVNANVKYSFKAEGVTPYVGGGLGLNFVSSTITIPGFLGFGGGELSSSDTKIGINLLGGVEMKFGNMTGFVQAGYNIVSDMGHLQFLAGVMVPMN